MLLLTNYLTLFLDDTGITKVIAINTKSTYSKQLDIEKIIHTMGKLTICKNCTYFFLHVTSLPPATRKLACKKHLRLPKR